MQVLRMAIFATLECAIHAAPVNFSRVSERSRVRLVLPAGGKCEGQVVSRTDSELAIKLSQATSECGRRDKLVTVRSSNARSIVRTTYHGKDAADFAITTFSIFGLLAGLEAQKPAAGASLAAGGVASMWLLNRHRVRYTIFIVELE
jgi:hypothetical protein